MHFDKLRAPCFPKGPLGGEVWTILRACSLARSLDGMDHE